MVELFFRQNPGLNEGSKSNPTQIKEAAKISTTMY